jgi:hypothetical protein
LRDINAFWMLLEKLRMCKKYKDIGEIGLKLISVRQIETCKMCRGNIVEALTNQFMVKVIRKYYRFSNSPV